MYYPHFCISLYTCATVCLITADYRRLPQTDIYWSAFADQYFLTADQFLSTADQF